MGSRAMLTVRASSSHNALGPMNRTTIDTATAPKAAPNKHNSPMRGKSGRRRRRGGDRTGAGSTGVEIAGSVRTVEEGSARVIGTTCQGRDSLARLYRGVRSDDRSYRASAGIATLNLAR